MRYIATREGVERLAGNGAVTKGQRELIQKLLTDFPDAVDLFEYEDYCKTPTLGTASAFISMALDANLHEIDSESGYMQYIATRPRVQKRGTHGLFSSATAVDLASAISELEAHEGNVWTIIYSLRREDADRLEYDNADAWRALLMENAPTLAKSMKISLDNFHWYAAFHDEGHHPHIHMMVWSDDPKEGFLTKDGIAAMRSKLTNAIFRDEMQQIYERKDVAYSDLVEAAQNAMQEMISRMQHQICGSPIIDANMRQLVQALETTTGKKQYGYLKKPLKQLIDTIVDALAELPEVSECYEVWNQIHEKLNECYGHSTPWERLPLSQRKEFRKIKNDIIREAENVRLGLPTFEDEGMQDEPEPESQKEEHQSYSVYEQAQRYRAAKVVLQDIYALDAEHAEAVKALEQLWEEGYTVAAHQLGKFYRDDLSTLRDHEKAEHIDACIIRQHEQAALQLRGVGKDAGQLRTAGGDIIAGHDLLIGVGGQTVGAGKISDKVFDTVSRKLTFDLLHGFARPVADVLVCTGQGVENSGFAGVRLTEKGDFSFVCHHACTSTCIRSDSARFSAIIVSRP